MSTRYTATFHPQAWVNDYAIEVDHDGPNSWDCSEEFAQLGDVYADQLLTDIEAFGEALDSFDWFKDDPAAPQWVRDHRGPFDIYITVDTDTESE